MNCIPPPPEKVEIAGENGLKTEIILCMSVMQQRTQKNM